MENEATKQASAANIQVFQGNAITDARYEMSVIEKQMVYMLLSLIKKDDRTQGLLKYCIHIKDIEKHSPKTITNYNVIKDATKKLVGRVYEINQKDSLHRKVLVQTSLLSSAKYVEGSGMVELTISPEIQPYLMDLLKGFTVYSLNCALSLRSIYSQRIYELLSRFKDLGTWRVKLVDLRYILKLENKYDGYGMFKQKVIEVAQKELAEKTDISFTVEEIKRGKKIEEFVFIINRRNDSSELRIEFNEDEKLFNRMVSEFKLAKWQAEHYLKTLDRPTIHQTLYSIKMAVQSGKVANIGAYSAQAFINLTLGKGIDEK
jgi:plasmid replication initiation protein